MDRLTEEQISHYREIFDEFDVDNSGYLGRDEVIQLMMVCGANPTDEEVDKWMREVDSDTRDGRIKINFNEFCSFMTKDPDPEGSLRSAFEALDKDGSGFLERSEVEDVLKDAGEDEDLKELLERALSDDGKIDYNEFTRLMMNKEP